MASTVTTQSPNKDRRASGRPAMPRQTRRVLNARLLASTLVVVAALVPALVLWHHYQVRVTAGAFLDRASAYEADQQWNDAAKYLHRYLRLHPENAEVHIRLAEVFDRTANHSAAKARAVELFYRALGVAAEDEQPKLRRLLGERLLELKRFAAVEAEAKKLLAIDEKDPVGLRLLALARYQQFRLGSVGPVAEDGTPIAEQVKAARARNPADVGLALLMAGIYREHPELLGQKEQTLSVAQREQAADAVVDRMVEAADHDPEAYLARYRYRLQYGRDGADADLDRALELGPENVQVLYAAAGRAQQSARLAALRRQPAEAIARFHQEAESHLRQAISVTPTYEPAYLALAQVCLAQQEVDEAIAALEDGLEQCGQRSLTLNLQLAELLIDAERIERAGRVVDLLDETTRQLAPRLSRAEKLGLDRSLSLLRAQWLIAQQKHFQAIPLLKRVMAGQRASREEALHVYRAGMGLGRVYVELGRWDQAVRVFSEVAVEQPKAIPPRLAAANALLQANQPDSAIRQCTQAISLGATAEAWMTMAFAQLQAQRKVPLADRRWDEFIHAVSEAKRLFAEQPPSMPWRLRLLEADYTLARAEERQNRAEGIREALAILRELEEQYAESPELVRRLAVAYQRFDANEDADRLLAKMDHDSVAACLLRSRIYQLRKQYDEASRVLNEALETFPPDQRVPLRHALGQLNLARGRVDEARRELAELHQADPTNVGLMQQLAEQALRAEDWADAKHWEEKLRDLEGEDGIVWRYCRARRLLGQSNSIHDPQFQEAAELQVKILEMRPDWHAAHLLGGLIQQVQGNPTKAIDALQEAIRLGESRLVVYERLVALLCQLRRFDEAATYLSSLRGQMPRSATLSGLEILVSVGRKQPDRAVALAQHWVERRPNDSEARLWLARALIAQGSHDKAVAAFEEAITAAPAEMGPYLELVKLCMLRDQKERAREVLRRLAEQPTLPAVRKAVVLAQAYKTLGDREAAEQHYREAQQLMPDDEKVQASLADFLLQSQDAEDIAQAHSMLRRLVASVPKTDGLRRRLAASLATQGGDPGWEEARSLLQKPGSSPEETRQNRRLLVRLLVRKNAPESQAEARHMLQSLLDGGSYPNADSDRLLLVRMEEAAGDVQAARRQWEKLVAGAAPEAAHLGGYVEFLLRNRQVAEAQRWLRQLAAAAPDDLQTARLTALLYRAQGREAQIEPYVEQFAKRLLARTEGVEQQAVLFARIGALYTSVRQYPAAERWYRKLVASNRKAYVGLVEALTLQGRFEEALQVCLSSANSQGDIARAAKTSLKVLDASPATPHLMALAEPLVSTALKQHGDDLELLMLTAALRTTRQEVPEAVSLYEQVLQAEPENVVALNNLAALLAENHQEKDKALEYIERAIELLGPQGPLLDTKGMILIYNDRIDEAIPYLEQAVKAPPPDPLHQLHLAAAYYRAGSLEKAKAAFDVAREGKVSDQQLNATDKQFFAELEKQFLPN